MNLPELMASDRARRAASWELLLAGALISAFLDGGHRVLRRPIVPSDGDRIWALARERHMIERELAWRS